MRDLGARLFLAACLVAQGCQVTPAITVVRTAPGDKAADVRGDPVKLKRGPQEAYTGAREGFFVVRTQDDWEGAWPEKYIPPMPATLDTTRQMLVLAVADKRDITNVRIQRAVETAERLFVWVKETKLGEHCVNKSNERAFDAVVAERIDKPVKFFVEEEPGESCGEPPVAGVVCRESSKQDWAKAITAQPGDIVECELTAMARGKFALVDKSLRVDDLPAGSSAKLRFAKGPHRAELEIDVYGTYAVVAEAVDEAGRRGKATATIDVKPPKTKDVLVQLVWTGFDLTDESDTFPRVNLRVTDESKGQRCSAEIPIPGLCDVKTRGAYTYMQIPAGSRRLPVSVHYLDERIEKGPGPCVHVWFDGQRTAETCDRKHRDPDEIWRVGVLETATGKLAIEGDPSAPSSSKADAGTTKP
jgi:hypothetical protein